MGSAKKGARIMCRCYPGHGDNPKKATGAPNAEVGGHMSPRVLSPEELEALDRNHKQRQLCCDYDLNRLDDESPTPQETLAQRFKGKTAD